MHTIFVFKFLDIRLVQGVYVALIFTLFYLIFRLCFFKDLFKTCKSMTLFFENALNVYFHVRDYVMKMVAALG